MDGGDAGADRTFADFKIAIAPDPFAQDQGRMADFYTRNVSDGVPLARSPIERYTEIASTWFCLSCERHNSEE